jgi:hypothetical protein
MVKKCKSLVWHSFAWMNCKRNAVRDGFCRQHHPSAVKERARLAKERARQIEAKLDEQDRKWQELERRAACFDELVAVLEMVERVIRDHNYKAPELSAQLLPLMRTIVDVLNRTKDVKFAGSRSAKR